MLCSFGFVRNSDPPKPSEAFNAVWKPSILSYNKLIASSPFIGSLLFITELVIWEKIEPENTVIVQMM